jgi:hypothetical protein
MADFGAVTQMGVGIYEGVMKFILYTAPFFFVAIILVGVYFWLRRRNLYGINCIIYTIADNNLIQGKDKGGIVKNLLGVDEFRFKKRKKGCPVPNRKHWVMQDNGKFCIHFYRHSEDDFEPVEAKPVYETCTETPIPNKKVGLIGKVKGLVNPSFPTDNKTVSFDMKEQFKGINFTPIKSESKQYLDMKAKESVFKYKVQKKFEQWKPVIMFGAVAICFIILVIWGFDYSKEVMNKQANCISAEVCQDVAEKVYNVAPKQETNTEPKQPGFKNPFEG